MKRILQISLLAIAVIFLFDSAKPVEAQSNHSGWSGYTGGTPYGTRRKAKRRKVKKKARRRTVKRRTKRRNRRYALSSEARVQRSFRRIKKARSRKRSKPRRARKPRVASFRKKYVPGKKKNHSAKSVKGPVQIVVSLPRQRVSIYKGGKVIASSRVSTGKSGHRTPSGVFSIIQKHKTHYSNLYNAAPMPYMQRITWSGIALHAGNVSRPYASHGCIRLPYGFARKLFTRTSMGAHVIVSSSSYSPKPISHDNLFQPRAKGVMQSVDGVQTAAYSGNSTAVDAAPAKELGGLPGFVKPVIAAKKRLEDKKRVLEAVIAAAPAFELTLEGAKNRHDDKKAAYLVARKNVVISKKALRRPLASVRKIKRQALPRRRTLHKLEKRAKFAMAIIDKRRDNPKYEGKWMETALARAAKREEGIARAKARLDEVLGRLEVASARYDALRDTHRKARELADMRNHELREAALLLKKAVSEHKASKRSVIASKKAVQAAKSGILAAQRREKLPLRILISPNRGGALVRDVQKMLAEAGFEPGPVDGAMGSKTRAAIKLFQRELEIAETGKITDKLVDDLYKQLGRTKKANAHMYVRQGFVELFDIPVNITEPNKKLGTHVYTAMHFENGALSADWTALTVKNAGQRRVKKRGKRKVSGVANGSAQKALGRIMIPDAVRRQVSMLLTPGSSMVISDKGMSHETGKGTDFVVLTK